MLRMEAGYLSLSCTFKRKEFIHVHTYQLARKGINPSFDKGAKAVRKILQPVAVGHQLFQRAQTAKIFRKIPGHQVWDEHVSYGILWLYSWVQHHLSTFKTWLRLGSSSDSGRHRRTLSARGPQNLAGLAAPLSCSEHVSFEAKGLDGKVSSKQPAA